MAVYRNIQTSFWTDATIADDFTPKDRYFYLYLFTNPHTNLCGCYAISKKQISWETGYPAETIDALLKRFEEDLNVIRYNKDTKEILLVNWHKYNWTSSDKFRKPLENEIREIRCNEFKQYLLEIFNGIDTVSIPYEYRSDTTVTDTDTDTDTDTVSVTVPDTVSHAHAHAREPEPDHDPKPGQADKVDQPENPVTKSEPVEDQTQVDKFERFWGLYPKHTNRLMAEQAWSRLQPDKELYEKIINSLELHVKNNPEWCRDDGRYIPRADNWLNECRWDDEIPKATSGSPPRATAPPKNHFETREDSDPDYAAIERRKLGIG